MAGILAARPTAETTPLVVLAPPSPTGVPLWQPVAPGGAPVPDPKSIEKLYSEGDDAPTDLHGIQEKMIAAFRSAPGGRPPTGSAR